VAKPTAAHAPETVLVGDISNHTGEGVFDGTLEPVVKLALEGAAFITAYDRTQLKSLGASDPTVKLDEATARQTALNVGVGVVLIGSLDKKGSEYAVTMKATRVVTGETIGTAEDTASNKDQVLFVAAKLAGKMRTALGDDTSESAQRFLAETLSATSLEAVHDYSTAMVALSNGKHEDALKSFSRAVDIDKDFGLAYAGMAMASRNLGQQAEGEKYVQLASSHMDRMTERERYRTRASSYLVRGSYKKCVDEYESLSTQFPSDSPALNNLAYCATQLRDMRKAYDKVKQASAIFPKRPVYRLNMSLYSSYGTDFQTGEKEAKALFDMDPAYPTAPIALAFVQLGQGHPEQAIETYGKLESSPLGASRKAAGLADVAIYDGRFAEAVKLLEQGAAADIAGKYSDKAAAKYAALAYTRLLQDKKQDAVRAAQDALGNSKTANIRFLAGRIFAMAGEYARAQALAKELAAEIQDERQAYAKLIEGNIALKKGDARGAMKLFTEGNALVDTWIGRFDLGRAELEAGALPEADSEFDRCIKRRGEALALFLEETPTYGYLPLAYYYAGRVREGMKNPNFKESYRMYLSIREKAGEDPLLADVRKRAGS
jgi:tetratricopeptide (TPR) repeat protein